MKKPTRIACDIPHTVAETKQSKADLRKAMLAMRRAVSKQTRVSRDAAICAALIDWFNQKPVQTLAVYYPINDEPDLMPVYDELARRGARLALPVVTNKQAPLAFGLWTPGDVLTAGAMDVPTPVADAERVQPDALLAPCVAFNRDRFRIGYGGGYYDRTLAVAPRPVALGIAYQDMLVDFEVGEHDIALDAILTEKGLYGD